MLATAVTASARCQPWMLIQPRSRPPTLARLTSAPHHEPPLFGWSAQCLANASRSARSSTSDSWETRACSGTGPRSVHSVGSVILAPVPVSTTNMRRLPRFIEYSTSTRRPTSGWNGCVTTSQPEC